MISYRSLFIHKNQKSFVFSGYVIPVKFLLTIVIRIHLCTKLIKMLMMISENVIVKMYLSNNSWTSSIWVVHHEGSFAHVNKLGHIARINHNISSVDRWTTNEYSKLSISSGNFYKRLFHMRGCNNKFSKCIDGESMKNMWNKSKKYLEFQAAHCILSTPSNVNVIVGSTRQDGRGGTTHRVSNTFLHPNYQGTESQLIADIAVVRTIFPFTFNNNVRPISLGPNTIIGSNEVFKIIMRKL